MLFLQECDRAFIKQSKQNRYTNRDKDDRDRKLFYGKTRFLHADSRFLLFCQDSCYEGKLEENECKIDIAIRLCVTVVAFSPESIRATQMLVSTQTDYTCMYCTVVNNFYEIHH